METNHSNLNHHHHHPDHPDGHVHFPEDQLVMHDSEIIIKPESERSIAVHLGFLQIKHHYEIKFTIKDKLNEDLNFNPLENLHVKVVTVEPSEDGEGHEVTLAFHTYKEKLLREQVTLTDSTDNSKTISLVLHARVLGKGKGTPALKTGIRCTGLDADYDSEQSDWQGFD